MRILPGTGNTKYLGWRGWIDAWAFWNASLVGETVSCQLSAAERARYSGATYTAIAYIIVTVGKSHCYATCYSSTCGNQQAHKSSQSMHPKGLRRTCNVLLKDTDYTYSPFSDYWRTFSNARITQRLWCFLAFALQMLADDLGWSCVPLHLVE